MMKRIITILLAILLLFGAFTPALAGGTAFNDVQPGAWYFPYVDFVHTNHVMQGTSETTFSPNANFTRAQVTATLFRMHNGRAANASDPRDNVFTDVPEDAWFAPYVTWANAEGIVDGVGDNRFAPNSAVSRQQFATMLYRFADALTNLDTSVRQGAGWDDFTDRGQIADWAVDGLTWAHYHGIITGRAATTIAPAGTATRAEAAAMLTRFIRHVERLSADFVLTISVEETTRPQGENFFVYVELKNQTGQDLEIIVDLLFFPFIPNWRPDPMDWPESRTILFPKDGVIRREPWCSSPPFDNPVRFGVGGAAGYGNYGDEPLSVGTHELRFSAAFYVICEQGKGNQRITVSSNTLTLTVQ